MSADIHRCDSCGQTCCVTFSSMPIHPLYCISCYDEKYADPEEDYEDEEEDDS